MGVANAEQLEGSGRIGTRALYNLVPPKGMPAQFGFQGLRPARLYRHRSRNGSEGLSIPAIVHNLTEAKRGTAAR